MSLKQVAKNKTRVAAEHGLLVSEARLNRLIQVDCCSSHWPWALSMIEWKTHSEFEACMFLCQIASTVAQFEKLFLGAHAGYIKAITMKKLRQDTIPVIAYDKMTESPKLCQPNKPVEDFATTGK